MLLVEIKSKNILQAKIIESAHHQMLSVGNWNCCAILHKCEVVNTTAQSQHKTWHKELAFNDLLAAGTNKPKLNN